MTDESFLKSKGLEPPQSTHAGPKYAKRLVELGCHVFPLKLGSKEPATKTGFLEALPDASAITGNYGVWMGASNLVAIDLDDYVEGNQCEQFMADLELPPTFTILTGSGGRSLWYAAPTGDLAPATNLLGYKGVDLRAAGSYALGPGNKLHSSNVKEGAPGTGDYLFDIAGPKEFVQLPLSLITAIGKAKAEKVAARKPKTGETGSAYAAYDADMRARIDRYVDNTVSAIATEFDEMQKWPEGYTDDKGGWEYGVLARTASLASLVKADWNTFGQDDAESLIELHAPHGGDFTIGQSVSKFQRALDNNDVEPRQLPFTPDEDDWFTSAPYVGSRPFGDASDGTVSAEELPVTKWPKYEQNDFGNSQRIAAWSRGNLFWLHDEKTWVRYNGIHWEKSDGAGDNAAVQALNVAFQIEQEHYPDVKDSPDDKKTPREKFYDWVQSQKMAGKYSAASRTAQMSEALNRSVQEFDVDPYLLGVLNGTVDLRTGELRKGSKDEMIATAAPVRYDPEAQAPIFDAYLEESMPDPEVRAYLQRVMGYSITGSTIEQLMFIHHGETNNGKSVLLDVLGALLGAYAGGADPKALIESKNDQHSTHIASLAGPRFLMMSETARGARLSDVLIKGITGGDKITARRLYQENKDLKVIGKIHIATNHLPHIVSSKSTNRRIHQITWPVTIADEKIDLELAQKIIAAELEGVLAWLVRGAVEWWTLLRQTQGGNRKTGRPSGLGIPAQVLADTAKYLRDEDEVAEWMEERTTPVENPTESASNLYRDYKGWCESRGSRPMSQKALSIELGLKGYEKTKTERFMAYPLTLLPLQQPSNWFDDSK